ncbi:MAG: shikimate kinase [Ruminococcaceae bacterium]|nr:shikimate kinase [Oscillospiraceae bacterium]
MSEKIYGLLGRKLGHSYSALIHPQLGCEDYRLIELEPEELEGFLRSENLGGVNVTIPYKVAVMPICDRLSPEAQAIGSVNTIVRGADGQLTGYNTDAAGLEYTIRRAGISIEDKKVLIFGSGGASLAAKYVCGKLGAREVLVISRSGEYNYSNLELNADADVLINCTPVGMFPNVDGMAADPALFPCCSGVVDMVYNPRRTDFLLGADELGIPCAYGLPMLVHQAKVAEEHFFGKAISDDMTERVLSGICRDTENIVLIGMPGCGKSTVGKLLGQLSGRRIIDLDAMISDTAGMSIPDIFAAEGESDFRRREHEAVLTAASQRGCIIVCGGGVVVTEANRAPLRRSGRVYQIERELSMLSREGRPLSLNADLGQMYSVRSPLYESFRDASVVNDRSPMDAANDIWRDFCENTGA